MVPVARRLTTQAAFPYLSPGCQRRRENASAGQKALLKTFKRDYVRLNPRPDAATVMAALDAWFEDYNEMHPHRALGMRSPPQFIRAHQPATCPV
jgi:putative transposase